MPRLLRLPSFKKPAIPPAGVSIGHGGRRDWLLLLAFLLFAQGYLLQQVFPALLAFTLVLYCSYLHSEFSPRLKAAREMERELVEGVEAKVRLNLSNPTSKKLKVGIYEDSLPRGFEAETPPPFIIGENSEKELKYGITPVKGVHRIKGPRVRVMDTRELYSLDITAGEEFEVEVYPSLEGIREEAAREENIRLATTHQRSYLGLQSMELESLKEFQPGDEPRHIEWKATARLGKLIVKDFLREVESDVYIVLDAGREMRKGIRSSRVDYGTALALKLAHLLGDYRVGAVVYDDARVRARVEAQKSPEQVKRIASSLKISPIHSNLLGLRFQEMSFGLEEKSRQFLRRVMPALKGRVSSSSGLTEALSTLPSSAYLILIVDITSHTAELVRMLSQLRDRHSVLLLTPNPVLFHDESRLSREELLRLYESYLERERIVKRLGAIVPTLDLGPSDLLEVVE